MPDNGLLVDRYFTELLNAGDFSGADEILAPDFIFYSPSDPGGRNAAGFRQFVNELRAAFSNKHFLELDRIVEGDRIALRFRMTGTHDGAFYGFPPMGTQIDVEGCDWIRVAEDRITEVRAYFDLMAIVQRLVMPPPMRAFAELIGKLMPR